MAFVTTVVLIVVVVVLIIALIVCVGCLYINKSLKNLDAKASTLASSNSLPVYKIPDKIETLGTYFEQLDSEECRMFVTKVRELEITVESGKQNQQNLDSASDLTAKDLESCSDMTAEDDGETKPEPEDKVSMDGEVGTDQVAQPEIVDFAVHEHVKDSMITHEHNDGISAVMKADPEFTFMESADDQTAGNEMPMFESDLNDRSYTYQNEGSIISVQQIAGQYDDSENVTRSVLIGQKNDAELLECSDSSISENNETDGSDTASEQTDDNITAGNFEENNSAYGTRNVTTENSSNESIEEDSASNYSFVDDTRNNVTENTPAVLEKEATMSTRSDLNSPDFDCQASGRSSRLQFLEFILNSNSSQGPSTPNTCTISLEELNEETKVKDKKKKKKRKSQMNRNEIFARSFEIAQFQYYLIRFKRRAARLRRINSSKVRPAVSRDHLFRSRSACSGRGLSFPDPNSKLEDQIAWQT